MKEEEKEINFQIRYDKATHEKIKIIADSEMRSLNSQIAYFLRKNVQEYEREHGEIVIEKK